MRKNRSNSNSPSANIWGLAIALKEFQEATEGGVVTPILPDRPSICWIRVVISQTGLGVRSPHSSRICYWRSHCWKRVLILQARRVRTRWALNLHFDYFWNSTSICPGGALADRAHRHDPCLVRKTKGHHTIRALNLHLDVILVEWSWYGILRLINSFMVRKKISNLMWNVPLS